jgi:hypothetical protein
VRSLSGSHLATNPGETSQPTTRNQQKDGRYSQRITALLGLYLHYGEQREHEASPLFLRQFTSHRNNPDKNLHSAAPTSRVETSNGAAMKKTLHSFAALLCLLTLLLSATSCLHDLHAAQPTQATCHHCPESAPPNHSVPSCCHVQQQQPSAVIASTDAEQPASLSNMASAFHSVLTGAFLALPTKNFAAPISSPPLIALRI